MNRTDRRRWIWIQWAAAASLATASGLTLVKLWGGLRSGSLAVWALMADSALDVLASGINFYFLRKARQPPDALHHYGYGKAESVASLSQSYIILFSAVLLGYQAVRKLVLHRPLLDLGVGYRVLGLSWMVTLVLTLFLELAYRRSRSLALRADAFHYQIDLLTNLGGLVSLYLVDHTGNLVWDALFSMGIVVYMSSGAIRIGRRSLMELLDRTLPMEENRKIREIIESFYPLIKNPHDFRSRRSGDRVFIEFHVEIPRDLSFERAHDLTEDLIERLREVFPQAEVTVHADPEGTHR